MNNEILDINSPDLAKIFSKFKKEFAYVFGDDSEFSDFVLDVFQRYSSLYNKDFKITFKEYIESILNKEVHLYITEKLESKEFEAVSKFIKFKFKGYDSKNSLKALETLNSFFSKYNYTPDLEDCLKIIEHDELLSSILEKVVTNNLNTFRRKGVEDVCDLISATFIVAYCMNSDINIDVIEDDEVDSKGTKENSREEVFVDDVVKSYLKEVGDLRLFTPEEEKQYGILLEQGDPYARTKFIESNLRLVINIAKRYVNRGMPFIDLIQEGNLGLIKAVDMFQPSKGYKFSTYASWWIRQAVTRAIHDKGRNVRIPVHINEKIKQIREMAETMEEESGKKPTFKQIAKAMNMKEDVIRAVFYADNDTVSLNSFVGDEEETELGDFVSDPKQSTEHEALDSILRSEIQSLFDSAGLTEREKGILERRFGFYDGYMYTLEECGKDFDITRERIRQIENKALMSLRNCKGIVSYASYMDNPEEAKRNIMKYRSELYQKRSDKYVKDQERRENDPKPIQFPDEKYGLCVDDKIFTIDRICKLLDSVELSRRDKTLIMKRFGLCGDKKYSLTELAIENKVSTATIREIELEVFYKFAEKESPEQIDDVKKIINQKEQGVVRRKEERVVRIVAPIVLNDSKKERGNDMKANKPITIYSQFEGYTKEEVDSVLKGLPLEDMEIIYARYGNDLNNTTQLNKLDKKKYQRLYSGIFSKIRRRLAKSSENGVQQKEKRIHRSLESIYVYFFEYTEEQVNTMLAKLSAKDIDVLRAKYGDNFKEPKANRVLTVEEKRYMYNSLLLKMKKILKKSYPEVKIADEVIVERNLKEKKKTVKKSSGEKKVQKGLSSVGDSSESSVDSNEVNKDIEATGDSSFDDIEQVTDKYSVEQQSPVVSDDEVESITKEVYVEILDMLRTPRFGQLMTTLGPKDAVIVSLRLGYVDGKCFSTESISEFLGISQQEVIDSTKGVLTMYRDTFNSFIDKAIEVTCEKTVQFVKKED